MNPSNIEVTNEHRVACANHIRRLAHYHPLEINNGEIPDLTKCRQNINTLAECIQYGFEDEQIKRLLRLQKFLNHPIAIALPIEGFTYNGQGFDVEIRIDRTRDTGDANAFESQNPQPTPPDLAIAPHDVMANVFYTNRRVHSIVPLVRHGAGASQISLAAQAQLQNAILALADNTDVATVLKIIKQDLTAAQIKKAMATALVTVFARIDTRSALCAESQVNAWEIGIREVNGE